MPGPVSDSYDPEFGTGDNARDVRDAVTEVRDKVSKTLPEELKPILAVVHGKAGALHAITLSEKQRRVMRFALNRALESL